MNTYYLTVDDETGEAKITTGITAQGQVINRVVGIVRGVLANYMAGNAYYAESEANLEYLPEIGSHRMAVVVSADADDRVIVSLYNTGRMPNLALLYLLNEMSTFEA